MRRARWKSVENYRFKDEIRVFIRLAMNDPTTQNIHDVVNMLERTYQSMKDYPRWEEDEDEVKEFASKAKKQVPTQESQPTRKPDVSVYEAYDEFQEKHEIPENDESFFYADFQRCCGSIFFGIADAADYSKMAV